MLFLSECAKSPVVQGGDKQRERVVRMATPSFDSTMVLLERHICVGVLMMQGEDLVKNKSEDKGVHQEENH